MFNRFFSEFAENWRIGWKQNSFRYRFVITVAIYIVMVSFLAGLLTDFEKRDGFSFSDPILNMFAPIDLTYMVFVLTYGLVLFAMVYFLKDPSYFMLGFQSYVLLLTLRIITIWLLPLNAPETTIPMNDPVVQSFGNGEILTKDLFFSGHTSAAFLFLFLAREKWARYLFLALGLLIGTSVILQHVHYTIDVIAAPFFSYTAFRIFYRWHRRMGWIEGATSKYYV